MSGVLRTQSEVAMEGALRGVGREPAALVLMAGLAMEGVRTRRAVRGRRLPGTSRSRAVTLT